MRRYHRSNRWIIVLIVILFMFCASVGLYFKARPAICTVVRNQSDDLLSAAANFGVAKALDSNTFAYDDLAVVTRSDNGDILGIEIDSIRLNQLKLTVIDGISSYLQQHNKGSASIPIGTLLPTEYTNGFGPRVNIPYEVTARSGIDFENQFVSVGINQTLHKIYLQIKFNACLFTIGSTVNFNVSVCVPAAQTVIVGKVPESYMNIIDGSGEHVVDNVLNFADVN